MIPRESAKSIVLGFSGLRGWVNEKDALRPLVDAWERAPDDEDQARAMAEEWRRDSQFVPTPADVWTLAQATGRPKAIGCERCDGTGFRVSQRRAVILGVQQVVDVAARCSCREGRVETKEARQ